MPDAKKLLGLAFPKKKDPDPTEHASLIAAVTAVGRLNAHFVFGEMQSMIPSKDTTLVQKALLCHALGTLAKEHPREVSGYNGALGPLMLTYMESADDMLAVNAIRSFPYVTVPDPVQEKNIVRKVRPRRPLMMGFPAPPLDGSPRGADPHPPIRTLIGRARSRASR